MNNIRGVTLIELMVSMTIGLFLIAAVGSVYLGNKNVYRTVDSLANIQDNLRFATLQLKNSVQQAGYYGRLKAPSLINGRKNSGSDLDPDLLPSVDCEAGGWSIDLDFAVEAPDTSSGNPFSSTCLAGDASQPSREYLEGTDILVVRRVSSIESLPGKSNDPLDSANEGRIYLRADVQRGELYVANGSDTPSGYDATLLEDRELITEMFYITPHSEPGDNVPTLRRMYLTTYSDRASLRAEQLATNVEDFQVQIGEDIDGDGDADRFVDPPDADAGRAISVRIWLLVRSDIRDADYEAPASFTLADHTYTPVATTKNFRRLQTNQTFSLRNR